MIGKRILWDADDVLIDRSTPAMVENYGWLYGIRVPEHLAYSRDSRVWGVDDPDIAIRRNLAFMHTEEFAMLPPNPAALAVLTMLAEEGFEHYVGTGRHGSLHQITEAACDRYFPGLIQSVMCGNYTAASGEVVRSKSAMSRHIGAAIHVDDHSVHVIDVAPTVERGFLYGDYPWNQDDILLPPNVMRVANLSLLGDQLLERVAA